jgi:hypothetical protein
MWLAAVRDLAIVLLAVESLVIGVLLLVLLVQLRKLVQMLREEIKPMLNSANDTVNTVNGPSVRQQSRGRSDCPGEQLRYWNPAGGR